MVNGFTTTIKFIIYYTTKLHFYFVLNSDTIIKQAAVLAGSRNKIWICFFSMETKFQIRLDGDKYPNQVDWRPTSAEDTFESFGTAAT